MSAVLQDRPEPGTVDLPRSLPGQEAHKRTQILIDAIRAETAITRITGHNDHAAKACPGFVVRNWCNRA